MAARRVPFLTTWLFFATLCSIPVLWQYKRELIAPIALSFVFAAGLILSVKYDPQAGETSTKKEILKTFLGFFGIFSFAFARQLFRFQWIPLSKPQLPSIKDAVAYIVLVTIVAAITTFLVWNALREKKIFTTLFDSTNSSSLK